MQHQKQGKLSYFAAGDWAEGKTRLWLENKCSHTWAKPRPFPLLAKTHPSRNPEFQNCSRKWIWPFSRHHKHLIFNMMPMKFSRRSENICLCSLLFFISQSCFCVVAQNEMVCLINSKLLSLLLFTQAALVSSGGLYCLQGCDVTICFNVLWLHHCPILPFDTILLKTRSTLSAILKTTWSSIILNDVHIVPMLTQLDIII